MISILFFFNPWINLEYVVEHIGKDIETNKSRAGIDFSEFLSEYIIFCTAHQYLSLHLRDNLRINLAFD